MNKEKAGETSPAFFSQNMTKKSSLFPLVYDGKMYHNIMEKIGQICCSLIK